MKQLGFSSISSISTFPFFFILSPVCLPTHRVLELGTDGFDAVWVPDDDVCVGAHRYPAFAWIQVEDFSSVGRRDSHKLVLIHLPHGLRDREEDVQRG